MEATARTTVRLHEADEIHIGRSSWDPEDVSIKYAWKDSRGHVARGGEIPLTVLPQLFEFAISSGALRLGAEGVTLPQPETPRP